MRRYQASKDRWLPYSITHHMTDILITTATGSDWNLIFIGKEFQFFAPPFLNGAGETSAPEGTELAALRQKSQSGTFGALKTSRGRCRESFRSNCLLSETFGLKMVTITTLASTLLSMSLISDRIIFPILSTSYFLQQAGGLPVSKINFY